MTTSILAKFPSVRRVWMKYCPLLLRFSLRVHLLCPPGSLRPSGFFSGRQLHRIPAPIYARSGERKLAIKLSTCTNVPKSFLNNWYTAAFTAAAAAPALFINIRQGINFDP
ncbi:hypothetical protein Zmor_012966 [Zophobas morio]|uniref:Uncharacterized protein n=1 Tax=Zophobas morio TaxID=2755281 RepID=A0AA38IH33_9CUCU|nr:hypothetical protein Zmor_012966 [Zophobas morio]